MPFTDERAAGTQVLGDERGQRGVGALDEPHDTPVADRRRPAMTSAAKVVSAPDRSAGRPQRVAAR
jgi:hypothetical protein